MRTKVWNWVSLSFKNVCGFFFYYVPWYLVTLTHLLNVIHEDVVEGLEHENIIVFAHHRLVPVERALVTGEKYQQILIDTYFEDSIHTVVDPKLHWWNLNVENVLFNKWILVFYFAVLTVLLRNYFIFPILQYFSFAKPKCERGGVSTFLKSGPYSIINLRCVFEISYMNNI